MTLDFRRPGTSPRRWAIAATAFAFFATMVGTTLPTALYSIYSARLSFSSLTVTVLFAVYALGVVFALLVFGRLSDQIGRRPVLLIALGCAAVSAVLFMLPPSLGLLIVARVISGFSAGFMSGAGTAAVIDLFPAARRSVGGMLAIAVNSGGLGVGNLLGGLVASFSASPLRVPFAIHLGLVVLAAAGLWLLTPRPGRQPGVRWRIQRLRVPAEIRGAFVRGVLAAGVAFSVSGVLTAVTALFLAEDLGVRNHWLAGLIVFLIFSTMALGQLAAGRVAPNRAIVGGCAGLVLAGVLLAVALGVVVLAPLVIAAVVLGVSGGFCLNGALATTVEQVPQEHRGEVSSAFFASLYVLLACPAIGVGLLGTAIGLRESGLVFAIVVAVLAVLVGAAQLRAGRRR
ncbi:MULTISPECIES: MFS transporter [unclassified Gordonia (in: high G+C Gram-positive bacteria)]|uniref:MFS transporter n=1 Tax=unclassified Gordonia (in: high G+C Gram-positive bacteria) TaxID=2657482 RepID=UPI0024B52EC3|nr:MFS transporter [Gordonia sp. PP30]